MQHLLFLKFDLRHVKNKQQGHAKINMGHRTPRFRIWKVAASEK